MFYSLLCTRLISISLALLKKWTKNTSDVEPCYVLSKSKTKLENEVSVVRISPLFTQDICLRRKHVISEKRIVWWETVSTERNMFCCKFGGRFTCRIVNGLGERLCTNWGNSRVCWKKWFLFPRNSVNDSTRDSLCHVFFTFKIAFHIRSLLAFLTSNCFQRTSVHVCDELNNKASRVGLSELREKKDCGPLNSGYHMTIWMSPSQQPFRVIPIFSLSFS